LILVPLATLRLRPFSLSSVHPFEVTNITLSLVQSLPTKFSLRRATFAWLVVFGLKMSLMRRVTVAQWGIFLHFLCHFRTVARPSSGGCQSSLAPILGSFLLEGISPTS
jgi:hypothetical protein